jgi:hypothetical protein
VFPPLRQTGHTLVHAHRSRRCATRVRVFEEMDSSETPGTRASVYLCEVKVQRRLSERIHPLSAVASRETQH